MITNLTKLSLFLKANCRLMTQKEKEILQDMLNTIQRVKDQTDYINTHERIPQLELDAIVARIQKLYELSVALKYFHAHIDDVVEEKQQLIKDILEKNSIDEDLVPTVVEEEIFEKEIETVEEIIEVEEQIIEAVEENEDQEIKQTIVEKEEPIEKIMHEMNTVGKESTHEKFAAKEDESIADKLMLQPIKDLKSAIGINDKFQFINELFGGNADDYNQTIAAINTAENKAAAMELISKKDWSSKKALAKSFYTLIERRFL